MEIQKPKEEIEQTYKLEQERKSTPTNIPTKLEHNREIENIAILDTLNGFEQSTKAIENRDEYLSPRLAAKGLNEGLNHLLFFK